MLDGKIPLIYENLGSSLVEEEGGRGKGTTLISDQSRTPKNNGENSTTFSNSPSAILNASAVTNGSTTSANGPARRRDSRHPNRPPGFVSAHRSGYKFEPTLILEPGEEDSEEFQKVEIRGWTVARETCDALGALLPLSRNINHLR